MSPEGGLPDDRLIERLGMALRAPGARPSTTELGRLREALAARRRHEEPVVPAELGARSSDGRLVSKAPGIDPAQAEQALAALDGPEELGTALEALAALVRSGEPARVAAARTELRARLQTVTSRAEPEARRRARRVLGAAARLLLSSVEPGSSPS